MKWNLKLISSVMLTTSAVLGSHVWLVATCLRGARLEHFHPSEIKLLNHKATVPIFLPPSLAPTHLPSEGPSF